jgi:uncharacterized coiled-coil DUF342 family protein
MSLNLGEMYRQSKMKKEANGEFKQKIDTLVSKQDDVSSRVDDLQSKYSELIQSHDKLKTEYDNFVSTCNANFKEFHDVIIDLSGRLTKNGF